MKKVLILVAVLFTGILAQASNPAMPDSKKSFFTAVKSGDLAVMDQLIKAGEIDPNIQDGQGNTALHLAAKARNLEMTQYLLELKDPAGNLVIKPNELNKDKKTALHLIAGYNPELSPQAQLPNGAEISRLLLEAGTNPDLKDSYDWNALHLAIKQGKEDVVRNLLAHEADMASKVSGNITALDLAIINNNANITSMLRAKLATKAPQPWTAIIDWNDVNKIINPTQATFIHWTVLDRALMMKDVTTLERLLRARYNPESLDKLLIQAVRNDDLSSVQLLLEHGANPKDAFSEIKKVDDSDMHDDKRIKDHNPYLRSLLQEYSQNSTSEKKLSALRQKRLDIAAYKGISLDELGLQDAAARSESTAILAGAIQNDPNDIDALLRNRVAQDDFEGVKYLLEHGANPRAQSGQTGRFGFPSDAFSQIKTVTSSYGTLLDADPRIRSLLDTYVPDSPMSAFKDMRVSMELGGKRTPFEAQIVQAYKQYEQGNPHALGALFNDQAIAEQVKALFAPRALPKIFAMSQAQQRKNLNIKAHEVTAEQIKQRNLIAQQENIEKERLASETKADLAYAQLRQSDPALQAAHKQIIALFDQGLKKIK